MHCVLTADFAAVIAEYGRSIIRTDEPIPTRAINEYWAVNRSRLDQWNRMLAEHRCAERSGDPISMRRWWYQHGTVLEEILVTEILARTMAALGAMVDDDLSQPDLSPVMHAVFMNHIEASNRVHQIVLHARGISVHEASSLNRLRQGVERWSDTLVGRMSAMRNEPLEYAVDPKRAGQFARDARSYDSGAARATATWLMNAAMQDMLRRRTTAVPTSPSANRRITASVLEMFRPDLFDSLGLIKSAWLQRLQDDVQGSDQAMKPEQVDPVVTADAAEKESDLHQPHAQRWYL